MRLFILLVAIAAWAQVPSQDSRNTNVIHTDTHFTIWALFAAAVAETPVSLEADLEGFAGSDADFVDNFFVPGIQRAGGLKAAKMLAQSVRNP